MSHSPELCAIPRIVCVPRCGKGTVLSENGEIVLGHLWAWRSHRSSTEEQIWVEKTGSTTGWKTEEEGPSQGRWQPAKAGQGQGPGP